MSELKKLKEYLRRRIGEKNNRVWIPNVWNQFESSPVYDRNEFEILVDYPEYLLHLMEEMKKNPPGSLDQIYALFPRYSTAWDVRKTGTISQGTLLRAFLLFPLFIKMKVSIVYLLPVTESSSKYMKGDQRSPFAVKNPWKVDTQLQDGLLAGEPGFSGETELQAFIEQAHNLGMRVITDFIPRTVARDSELIREHPDWFYWIRKDKLPGYGSPRVESLGNFLEPRSELTPAVYSSPEVQRHLKKFFPDPRSLDGEKWARLLAGQKESGRNLLDCIEADFELTTAPAFSDWINDTQPIWEDVTFYRNYFDLPPEVAAQVALDQAPFICFEIIKSSNFQGAEPNTGLWAYLEETIFRNMMNWGFDGFRIDMGHALPKELEKKLISRMRELKPDALVLSEELFHQGHSKAKISGYGCFQGESWLTYSQLSRTAFSQLLEKQRQLTIPSMAAPEIPDTPRLTTRTGGALNSYLGYTLNLFTPRSIPFITTGFEVLEDGHLNTALADNNQGSEATRAFFQSSFINWSRQGGQDFLNYLIFAAEIKDRYRHILGEDGLVEWETGNEAVCIAFKMPQEDLVVTVNTDLSQNQILPLYQDEISQVLLSHPVYDESQKSKSPIVLTPGQSMIFRRSKERKNV